MPGSPEKRAIDPQSLRRRRAKRSRRMRDLLFALAIRFRSEEREHYNGVQLDPNSWNAHSNLGTALLQMPGRLADAIAEYETALRIGPDTATAHSNLGYALSGMADRLPDAAAEYRRALQLDPNNASLHYNLAAVLARMPGRREEALAEYEAALRLNPSPQLQEFVERLRAPKK
jgi:tetratricopeptide (TPR) repeat protein